MPTEPWVSLVQTFGVAVAILFFMGVAAWKTLAWVGREIIIPVRDKVISQFIEFLTKMRDALVKIESAIERQADILERFECKAMTRDLHQIMPPPPNQPR